MGFPQMFVGAMGVMQYQAQGKIGKYNQSVNERNAEVLNLKKIFQKLKVKLQLL
jgi:hypothetical protein